MMSLLKQSLVASIFVFAAFPSEWTQPVEVRHDSQLVAAYQAKWNGDFLIVRAAIQPGWHTFAMDNKQRQQEKLAGKPSLGIEKSTEIVVSGGLNVTGPWLQSAPKDFSKPEIRWFTWGFDREATFAAKARRTGSDPARVELRAQACAGEICKNIDVSLAVPLDSKNAQDAGVDLKNLVQVR
jgi:DsbC/DsbD-like thiol-disulfide interchange protein